MDCLHICVFPKHELDGITADESLCSAARSVVPATDAADHGAVCRASLRRYVQICGGSWVDRFVMIDGDVYGS